MRALCVLLVAVAALLAPAATVAQQPSPPVWPTYWAAKIQAGGSGPTPSILTMYCDYQNGRSRADYDVVGYASLSLIWDYKSGYFYQFTNQTCVRSPVRQSTMGMMPSFQNFTYVGPNTYDNVPVEQWQGKWTVKPSPFYNSDTFYYVNQVIGTPKLAYFNPYPSDHNNAFNFKSYTTQYDAWNTYVSPTVGCMNGPMRDYASLRQELVNRFGMPLSVEACNPVA